MNKDMKKLICKLFPGENLRYALYTNDYGMAVDILLSAVGVFIDEFDLENAGEGIYRAFSCDDYSQLQTIFYCCEKVYFLEVASDVVSFFSDLYSGNLRRRKFAQSNTLIAFSAITALNDVCHYTKEDIEAFLLDVFQKGKDCVSFGPSEDIVDYIAVLEAFLDKDAEMLVRRVCNSPKEDVLMRERITDEKKPDSDANFE